MGGITVPIVVEGGRCDSDTNRRGTVLEQTLKRRGTGPSERPLVKKNSRSKIKSFQIQINLEQDTSSFKNKPQFTKRRSVPKLGVPCDPCEKVVTLNMDCVTSTKPLTRRQSSKDLLSLAKPAVVTRSLTRRQSSGRDLLGVDRRRNSCGKTRNALRLSSKSALDIDKENNSTLTQLSAINLGPSDKQFGQFEREARDTHNKYRAWHGVGPLHLDRKLCTVAQEYADILATTDTFIHSNDPLYGENLYWSWSSDPRWVVPGREAVDSWYQEGRDYNYSTEQGDTESGHFTQLVWSQSRHLGVGVAKSSTSDKFIVVMKYHPAGNYLGKYRENVFKPEHCVGEKNMICN